MQDGRRQFLRTGATLALTTGFPVAQSAPAGSPVRMSLESFMAVAGNVDKLRLLFAEMRKKRASDPASYFFQAAIHWWPDLSADAVKQNPDRKVLAEMFNADQNAKGMLGFWNQCTHLGVKSPADFVLWHRAYLYYFERYARSTLKDATFALPYWDYRAGTTASLELPAPYRGRQLAGGADNPLYPLGGLRRTLDTAGSRLDADDADPAQCMKNDYFFSGSGFTGFGESAGTVDSIDHTPHGMVHGGIGGWMASVRTAAFDPVFWAHHANIDRLFNQWLARRRFWSRDQSQEQIESWLNAAVYTFIDTSGQPDTKPRRFFLEQSNLGYVYDTDPPKINLPQMPTANLVAAAGAVGGGKSLAAVPKEVKGFVEKEAGALGKPVSVPAATGLRFVVPLALPDPKVAPAGAGKLPLAIAMQSTGKYTYTVIDLENVRKAGDSGGNYAVFVGPLSEAAKDAKSPAYVGRFSAFDVPDEKDVGKGAKYRFDITRQLEAMKKLAGTQSLAVRVLPVGAVGEDGKPLPIERPGSLIVGNVVVRSLVGSTAQLK
jgi:hypothetical protein